MFRLVRVRGRGRVRVRVRAGVEVGVRARARARARARVLGHLGDDCVGAHGLDPRAQSGHVAARLLGVIVREVLGRKVREEQLDLVTG